jgi:maleylpyruvate isomerase
VKLYGYFRSSASYRVRIGLALKGLGYDSVPVHLTRDGGEQHRDAYARLNPQKLIPVLVDRERAIPQSLAILEYLEERHPEPPLLPATAGERARVRSLALAVACDIHPLNNLRVLAYLTGELGIDEDAKLRWYRHWVAEGLGALEGALASSDETGRFCHGDRPTIADCCLVPQVFNARRFDCPLESYPTVIRIEAACLALPELERALPENQPDAKA